MKYLLIALLAVFMHNAVLVAANGVYDAHRVDEWADCHADAKTKQDRKDCDEEFGFSSEFEDYEENEKDSK